MATKPIRCPIKSDAGSLLLVVNSYSSHSRFQHLPGIDAALEAYVKTFYQHLYFRVYTAIDCETVGSLTTYIDRFTELSKDDALLAFVFVGHGEIHDGEECIITNAGETLPISKVIEHFRIHTPSKKKLFFIDACRTAPPDEARPPAVPPLPENTFIVYSTLSRQDAWYDQSVPFRPTYGAWSYCFNEIFRNSFGSLQSLLTSVQLKMKKDLKIVQIPEVRCTDVTILTLRLNSRRNVRRLPKVLQVLIHSYMKGELHVHRRQGAVMQRVEMSPEVDALYESILEDIGEVLERSSPNDLKRISQMIEAQLQQNAEEMIYTPKVGKTASEILDFIKQSSNYFSDLSTLVKPLIVKYGCNILKDKMKDLRRTVKQSLPELLVCIDMNQYDAAIHSGSKVEVKVKVRENVDVIRNERLWLLQETLNKKLKLPIAFFTYLRAGCTELIFLVDANSALLVPSRIFDHLNELARMSVMEVTLFGCIRVTVDTGKVEFVGTEEDFQLLSSRYLSMKNKLKTLSREAVISSHLPLKNKLKTLSREAVISRQESIDATLSRITSTWKQIENMHQTSVQKMEVLAAVDLPFQRPQGNKKTGRHWVIAAPSGNKKTGRLCSHQPRCQPIHFIMLLFSLVLILLTTFIIIFSTLVSRYMGVDAPCTMSGYCVGDSQTSQEREHACVMCLD